MEYSKNKQIRLAKRPEGMPGKECFETVETAIPSLHENQILTENIYMSVDPYMRGRMADPGSGAFSIKLHGLIPGRTIGRVVKSRSQSIKEGDYVIGMMGWEEYSVINHDDVEKIDADIAPLSAHLGVIGMTGLTAYFGLLHVGEPASGETVVISGAAGAVGNVAGQIAKIKGCRVTGIAGSDAKTRMLKEELHFDEAINYKTSGDLAGDLKKACPKGVDVYFDNVGGEISDAVLSQINQNARIAICGQISLYNLEKMPVGPRVQPILLGHTAKMQGFMVGNFAAHYPEAREQMGTWLKEGKLVSQEHIVEGFDKIPDAFIGLFKGDNTGKQVVKLR